MHILYNAADHWLDPLDKLTSRIALSDSLSGKLVIMPFVGGTAKYGTFSINSIWPVLQLIITRTSEDIRDFSAGNKSLQI